MGLPVTKEPIAPRTSQLPRMIPRVSSLPRKEMRSSLNRTICAMIPLSPLISKEVLRVRLFIYKSLSETVPKKNGK
jgi:hypothetical protein